MDPRVECLLDLLQKCTLAFRCIAKGSSDVIVTLQSAEGRAVEFAYRKKCRQPRVRVASEVVTDRLALLMLLGAGFTIALAVITWRSRAPVKHAHTLDA